MPVVKSKAPPVDLKRREALTKATAAVGLAGVAMAAVPFLSSMMPSAAAIAAGAPVRVDLSEMQEGDQLTVEWRKKPIWIIKRTQAVIDGLMQMQAHLRDPESSAQQQPEYIKTPWRSLKPEYLILVGVCTHLGCAPTYRPDVNGVEDQWPGGFFCSCHGSKFDLAGRVYTGVPAPLNLEVPPHTYTDATTLVIGQEPTPAQMDAILQSQAVQAWETVA